MLDDIERARAIEAQFAITERLKRRVKTTPVIAGQDPFEEPGHVPVPRAKPNQRIPSSLLVYLTRERYTPVDFVPTFGSAIMYDHWIIGGVIVLLGVAAKWGCRRKLESYRI